MFVTWLRCVASAPFGQPGRARRVEDRGVVVGRDRRRRAAARVRSSRRAQVLPAHDAGGHVAAVAATTTVVAASSPARCGARRSSRSPSRSSASGAGVGEGVLELGTEPPRVERDGDRAERHRGPEADDPLRVVAHPDGDAVALADALLVGEPGGEAGRRAPRCSAVRRALAVVDEEVAVAERRGRGEDVAHRRRGLREHAQRHAVARRSSPTRTAAPAAVSTAMASARVAATCLDPLVAPVPPVRTGSAASMYARS